MGKAEGRTWLPRLGSNQGFQLQRLACYHYTTGHREFLIFIVLAWAAGVKGRARPQRELVRRGCYNSEELRGR